MRPIKVEKMHPSYPDLKWRRGDGGIDVPAPDDIQMMAGQLTQVVLPYRFEPAPGVHLMMVQKSRHRGLFVVQAPLVDSNYRGFPTFCAVGIVDHFFNAGESLIQLMPIKGWDYSGPDMPAIVYAEVNRETERGEGWDGSTG